MSSAMMMERTGAVLPGVGAPTPGGTPATTPASWLMVPRGTVRFEKCQGGLKVYCACADRTASGMVQNLCAALAGGLVSCAVQWNGLATCTCQFVQGLCRCEPTADGVCVTCTSGDAKCCEMLQAACDCLSCMMEAGCTCCLMMNNTPVCSGSCEPSKSGTKAKR